MYYTIDYKKNKQAYRVTVDNLLTVFKYLLQSEKIYCHYNNRASKYITIDFKNLLLAFYSIAITLFICFNFYAIDKSYTQSKKYVDNMQKVYYQQNED